MGLIKNIDFLPCELCGDPETHLYSLFPETYFQRKDSPHWFLCKKCQRNFKILRTYIENKIFFLHKADYAYINMCAIIKQNNRGSNVSKKKHILIDFNPHRVFKYGYKKGSKKGNNGYLRENKCAICGNRENLTVHHLFKRAVFGEKDNNCTITLCTDCHIRLEKEIDEMEKNILEPMKELYYFIQNLLYFKKINFEDDKIFFIHINEGDGKYSFILERKMEFK